MKRIFALFSVLALAFSLSFVSGCTDDDAEITCANFDDFLYYCTDNCSPTWDCEANYDTLLVEDQMDLDDCSDCLVDNLDSGVCADCTIDGYSCYDFMEDFLGVDCW